MNFYKSIFYLYVFWIKKLFIIKDITLVTKYYEIIYDKKKFLNQILDKMNLSLFNNIIVNKKHIHSLGGSGVRESYEKLKYDNNLDHLNFFEFLLSYILLMPLNFFQKIYLIVKR